MKKSHHNKIAACIVGFMGLVFFLLLMSIMVQSAKAASANSALYVVTLTPTRTHIPPEISLSYNKPVTSTGSLCSTATGPEKAVDGLWNTYSSAWCSSADNKWIQIDLGQNYYITGIDIQHGSSPVKNFSIYGMQYTGSPWTQLKLIKTVTNNTKTETWYTFTVGSNAPTVRWLRVSINNNDPSAGNNTASLDDILVGGVPAP